MHCRRFPPLEGPREERPGLKNPPSARSASLVRPARLFLGPLPSAPPAGMRLLQDGELLLGARLGSLDGLPRLCPRRWACPTSATTAPEMSSSGRTAPLAGPQSSSKTACCAFTPRLVQTPRLLVGYGLGWLALNQRARAGADSSSRQRRCTLESRDHEDFLLEMPAE